MTRLRDQPHLLVFRGTSRVVGLRAEVHCAILAVLRFVLPAVQARSGYKDRLSEPTSRRFLVPALRAGPGTKIRDVFAAPPPAWGQINLVFRNPGLQSPPRIRKLRGRGLDPGFLVRRFLVRVLGCTGSTEVRAPHGLSLRRPGSQASSGALRASLSYGAPSSVHSLCVLSAPACLPARLSLTLLSRPCRPDSKPTIRFVRTPPESGRRVQT